MTNLSSRAGGGTRRRIAAQTTRLLTERKSATTSASAGLPPPHLRESAAKASETAFENGVAPLVPSRFVQSAMLVRILRSQQRRPTPMPAAYYPHFLTFRGRSVVDLT